MKQFITEAQRLQKLAGIVLKPLNEAKQAGNLYHFTPLYNLENILSSKYIKPNDQGVVSTSIRPNMSVDFHPDMSEEPIVRLMLDGDKISNKYKIQPFAFNEFDEDYEDLGEEQIIVNGKVFPFLPYLKRIDIFLNEEEEIDSKITEILEKANIPYKIYQGTPISNIPYTQPKS